MEEEINPGRRRFLEAAAMTVAAAQLGAIASAKNAIEIIYFRPGGEGTFLSIDCRELEAT